MIDIQDNYMRLEYLFLDPAKKEHISGYEVFNEKNADNQPNIEKRIIDLEGTDKWILIFTVKGRNETNAKALSKINDDIIKNSPVVLANGCAAYFNRRLFPIANTFERKIRKLIYLKSALYNDQADDKSKVTIKGLEKLDLGKIYELLFADEKLVKQFRQDVGSKNASKQYYQKVLSELEEHSIWNTLMGDIENDYLKDHFLDLVTYRNDIMHAHNIAYSDYCEHRKTFMKAIEMIDTEIEKLISDPTPSENTLLTVKELANKIIERNGNRGLRFVVKPLNDFFDEKAIVEAISTKVLQALEENGEIKIEESEELK